MAERLTRATALALLGVGEAASTEEIRASYRDLVKVWHPDRFGGDWALQLKAEEQLKHLNAALEFFLSPAGRQPGASGALVTEPRLSHSSPERYGLSQDDIARLRRFWWRAVGLHFTTFIFLGSILFLLEFEPRGWQWLGSSFVALTFGTLLAFIPALLGMLALEAALSVIWPKFRRYRHYRNDNNLPW